MELIAALLTSRLGQIALAFLIGTGLGWWKTDASWHRYEKEQRAAAEVLHQMELAREAANAVEIAKAATERVEEDQADLVGLQKQLDDFSKDAANAKDPCLMDDRLIDAARRMRQPAPSRHRAKVTRPPKGSH